MLLPCCCGCEPRPTPVLRFTNATRVTDYSLTPDPAGIAPYKRVNLACISGACDEVTCDPGDPVCVTMGYDRTTPPNAWTIPGILPAGSGGGELVSQIADNVYSNSGGTLQEFPSHCTYGWKGVAAMALWPGVFGFVDSGAPCCTDGGQPQTKYTSKTVTMSGTGVSKYVRKDSVDGVSPDLTIDFYYTMEATATVSLDDYGNATRSGSIRVQTWEVVNGVEQNRFDWCDGTNPGFRAGNLSSIGHFIPQNDMPLVAECGIITIGGGSHPTADFPATTGTLSELNSTEFFEIGENSVGEACSGGGNAEIIRDIDAPQPLFTLTDNELGVSWSATESVEQYDCYEGDRVLYATQDCEISFEKKIVLSGEKTYASVLAEAESLLGEYPLTDDRIYPWRTDAKTWLLPFVTRDAGEGAMGYAYVSTGCEPPTNDVFYSGEIRGAPLPPGYGRHFNFHQKVWTACLSGSLICNACETGLGETSPDQLPISATQWIDLHDGADMRGAGAHIWNIQGGQYGNSTEYILQGVMVQKWAETLTKWPKYNAGRPCARDRYLYDEEAFVCGSLSGSDLTLDDPATLSGKVAIEDGVYQITGGSGTAYTVGAKLYDTPVTCDGGVAPLRFPTARGICGEEDCTVVQTSPGLVTVTTARKHWLKGGGTEQDTVTITGIGGLSSHTSTVVDETTFTVSGTITGTILTGKVNQGGVVADDTTCSAHTFIARVWQSNYRGAALNAEDPWTVEETEETKSPIARHPTVLWSSPNDSFPHGYEIPWGSIAYDGCYGEQWSAGFEQAMADPLWQAPHAPCGGGTWEQRDNPCDAPDSTHYAFPPLVEATLEHSTNNAMPGARSHPHCEIDPTPQGIAMSWRPSWLTCTDWEELIAAKC